MNKGGKVHLKIKVDIVKTESRDRTVIHRETRNTSTQPEVYLCYSVCTPHPPPTSLILAQVQKGRIQSRLTLTLHWRACRMDRAGHMDHVVRLRNM